MTENVQYIQDRPDELELIALIERGVNFLRRFGLVIIIFSIVGLGLGLLLYTLSPKLYSSTLFLHSVILTNEEEIAIIDNWADLLKKGERPTVARALNLDSASAGKLNKIEASQIQKLYITNNPNGFVVEVLVSDTSVLDELQNGIISGLESSEYVRERVATKKANINEMIVKVKTELAKLDSMKTAVQEIVTHRTSGNSSFMLDVTGINGQWIALNEKLLSYQEELKFVNAVQVLQNFNKIRKPESPKLFKLLFFGLVAGLFMGYIIASLKYIRSKLKSRASTNATIA